MVSIHTNGGLYALRMRQRAERITPQLVAAMREVGKLMKRRAVTLSSGPYSLAELRRMGHPYARRAPVPIGTRYPAMINVQTGKFRASWHYRTRANTTSITTTLSNSAPEARYLTSAGTRLMVGRPVLEDLVREVREDCFGAAVKALRGSMLPAVPATMGGLPAVWSGGAGGGGGGGGGGAGGRGLNLLGALVSGFGAGFALGAWGMDTFGDALED